MKYLKLFSSVDTAIGNSVNTPNVCCVRNMKNVLYVPKLSVDDVKIIEDEDFINYSSLIGAYLLTTDGQLLNSSSEKLKDSYTSSEVVGIVVSTKLGALLLPATELKKAYFCNGKSKCENAIAYADGYGALSIGYVGKENTDIFRATLTGDMNWAVNLAYNTMLNGQHCWLPSIRELHDIWAYKTEITSLLTRCGVTWNFNEIWSSTLNKRTDEGYLWYVHGVYWKENETGNNNAEMDGFNVQGEYTVLPVTSYKL